MIIYGWGKDLKKVGYAGIAKCANCNNFSHFWVCEHSSHASLYFIRIAKWDKKLVCLCGTCERGWEIEPAKQDEVIRQTLALPSYEDAHTMWGKFEKSVSQAIDENERNGQEVLMASVTEAITSTVEQLKREYQVDHALYVAGRYVTYLQDQK